MKPALIGAKLDHKPNLFIVGAMKCGTTIMFDFLTSHPEISGGIAKEIHYFSLNFEESDIWYESKFKSSEVAKYLLDASPTYFDMCLTMPVAERIKTYSPSAKIIIMIRNPVDRAVSHFNHLIKVNETEVLTNISFDEFAFPSADLDKEDAEVGKLRNLVFDFSFYHDKINHFCNIFGSENVLLIHNDDLRQHGARVMDETFKFLGLSSIQNVDFSRQKYRHGSENVNISRTTMARLAEKFGGDFILSCHSAMPTKLSPLPGIVFYDPVGAIANDVMIGKNGWLFLAKGSNSPLDMFSTSDEELTELTASWRKVITERQEVLTDMGVQYFHCVVPEKISIVERFLPWKIDLSRSFGRALYASCDDELRKNIVFLHDYFVRVGSNSALYFKTDSHWNFSGAFAAYEMICSRLGVKANGNLLSNSFVEGQIRFDLGSKIVGWPTEHGKFISFRKAAKIIEEGELVQFKKTNGLENESGLHVGSFILFANPEEVVNKRLMIFGDSFCETRDHSLTALLAETFKEVAFAWSSSLDFSLIREYQPDVLFCIMSERFMRRIPNDSFDLRNHALSAIDDYLGLA